MARRVPADRSMNPSALSDRILKIAADAGFGAVAVVVHDYESGWEFALGGDRVFHAASTIKVPLLLAIYKLAEDGRLHLDDTLHVRNRFRSLAGGEVFRVAANRDGDCAVHRRVGRSTFQPERMQGWYEIVFRNTRNGRRRVFNLDELAAACRD